jgi:predicted short-subunit dehydrogenase-like oxidoreductase (DUF2520 family)
MIRKSTTRKTPDGRMPADLSIAIIGAGRLASFLAVALHDAGFKVTEIIVRSSVRSRRGARAIAKKVGAKIVTADSAGLDAGLLWFCVPDREIGSAARALTRTLTRTLSRTLTRTLSRALTRTLSRTLTRTLTRTMARLDSCRKNQVRYAFHSSGALLGSELGALRKSGFTIASVHPLMTFVAGTHPSLDGVPFALEGDASAVRLARAVVRRLGAESFSLPAKHKAAYHAWATLTSPLLLAFLVTLEEAAGAAGLRRNDARRKSLPIIMQTLANYARLGGAKSFSGPLIRGDADTVGKHLAALKTHPGAREVYVALARIALDGLPVKNRARLKRLLRS